uniref:Uncharacterized protein n=1 Tax=Rhodnius prolixus TaxID=13249 RepID=T1HJ35_RHOPR
MADRGSEGRFGGKGIRLEKMEGEMARSSFTSNDEATVAFIERCKAIKWQFTDVFQLEVFILTLFKPFESTFISHISTYLDVIAYLYIFD